MLNKKHVCLDDHRPVCSVGAGPLVVLREGGLRDDVQAIRLKHVFVVVVVMRHSCYACIMLVLVFIVLSMRVCVCVYVTVCVCAVMLVVPVRGLPLPLAVRNLLQLAVRKAELVSLTAYVPALTI